ncbi:MAG TPA: guanylate kinase [Desulfomonilaceae bacterium]|nr:guanylate kinase [Desulfomonilaceae bacterium]
MAQGRLFVLSAPSGAGKSTLISRLRPMFTDMLYSVSCTTRHPRAGETDGVDYFFVSEDNFTNMVDKGEFLEWKQVHGNLYGTPAGPVLRVLSSGLRMILDIDVQGARDVFRKLNDAVGIFISAPSMNILERRLRNRASESEESIHTRLSNAAREMEMAGLFRYHVVNDDLDTAVSEVADIIRRESPPIGQ